MHKKIIKINLKKEWTSKKAYLKTSIIQKLYKANKLQKLNNVSSFWIGIKILKLKKSKKLCFFTGRNRGVINKLSMSRQTVNNTLTKGQLQNYFLNTW